MKFNLGKFQPGRLTLLPVFIGQSGEQFGLNLNDYHGKKKDHPVWFDQDGTRFVVVGLGQQDKFEPNKLRDAVAFGARAAIKEAKQDITVLLPEGTNVSEAELVHTVVEGYVLGQYRFEKYRKQETNTVETITVAKQSGELKGHEDVITKAQVYAEGNNVSRDLKNEPSNKLRPYDLAEYVQNLFKDTDATVEVIKGDDLVKNQMNGLLAVGKGSVHPPAMIKVTYQTDASLPLTALVGKGLTFDSGGISLKVGTRDLSNMRMDMGGSGAVIGAMYILTRLQAKANVVMLVPTAENMPDANSMLPGEVIEYPNGVNVQVGNTDAEGRLVLADALILADKLGAARVVDIATLTGACLMALGTKLAGVWGEDTMVDGLKKSAAFTGEKIWHMPLVEEYEEYLYSPIAHTKNITDYPYAGAISAALFLRKFTGENQKWAHLDIAGPMDVNKTHTYSNEGATGFGARLLADWVLNA
ncbi:MAG TPA: leucyl aminopeptidase family protein [Bacilli bacterium]|nr:leucyl aminopeptidase family protein [Bacilli bacterium]